MHELSVCRDILDIVTSRLESAGGGRLLNVYVETGPHSCVNLDLIRSAFQASVKGTELEGADLALEYRQLRYRCFNCGRLGTEQRAGAIRRLLVRSCPDCGSRRWKQEIDDVIKIRSMEIE